MAGRMGLRGTNGFTGRRSVEHLVNLSSRDWERRSGRGQRPRQKPGFLKTMSVPAWPGCQRCLTASNVNRACGPLLEKRPVHPGQSSALKGTIKYELVWTFLDHQVRASNHAAEAGSQARLRRQAPRGYWRHQPRAAEGPQLAVEQVDTPGRGWYTVCAGPFSALGG